MPGLRFANVAFPRRCRGLLSCAPQERGSKYRHPDVVAKDVGARRASPFVPGIRCAMPDASFRPSQGVISSVFLPWHCAPSPPCHSERFQPCHFERSEKSCPKKAKISQSLTLTCVRGQLLRNDMGSALMPGLRFSHVAFPRRCRGLLSCAPQERGSKRLRNDRGSAPLTFVRAWRVGNDATSRAGAADQQKARGGRRCGGVIAGQCPRRSPD